MKKILTLALVALISLPSLYAQQFANAKALLQASYEKSGGDKWKNVQNIHTTGSINITGGPYGDMEGTIDMTMKFPGSMRMVMGLSVAGQDVEVTQVVTPEKGWVDVSVQGKNDLPEDQVKKMSEAIKYPNEEMELLETEDTNLTLAEETFENQAVYTVSVKKDDQTSYRYYDKTTLLPIATKSTVEAEGESIETVSHMEDYKDVNGLMIAHTHRDKAGEQERTTKSKTVEVNVTIDDKLFKD